MSPSPAIKTSPSLDDRKTLLGSPGLLAKPKNFRLMGGGGGMVGRVYCFALSVVPFALGFSIGRDPVTKIFLPMPAYSVPSLWESKSSWRVGSRRGSAGLTTRPEAVRRVFTRVKPPAGGVVAAAGAASGA